MLNEMEYERISIKELTSRAQINRKTFYLHYKSLDNLLEELQKEFYEEFIKRTLSHNSLLDMPAINRNFFLFATQDPLHLKLICNNSHQSIGSKVTRWIINYIKQSTAMFSRFNLATQNILIAYMTSASIEMLKQWVSDDQKMPLEDIISLAEKLLCNGLYGLSEKVEANKERISPNRPV
ncbi:MAG: TetR/AcrR family transcriptional regulator [Treponema sp.]|jgi:AcrR family transcriptional regulator|nr:TetR/AcrR family transcriptional regulator [Treponema sp.]